MYIRRKWSFSRLLLPTALAVDGFSLDRSVFWRKNTTRFNNSYFTYIFKSLQISFLAEDRAPHLFANYMPHSPMVRSTVHSITFALCKGSPVMLFRYSGRLADAYLSSPEFRLFVRFANGISTVFRLFIIPSPKPCGRHIIIILWTRLRISCVCMPLEQINNRWHLMYSGP